MAKNINAEAVKMLADVPFEYVFYLNDGRILKNMENLRDVLYSMSDELFAYHVNAEKNDFSKWVIDIIVDEKLAKDLFRAKDKMQAFKAVSQRVAFLKGKLPYTHH